MPGQNCLFNAGRPRSTPGHTGWSGDKTRRAARPGGRSCDKSRIVLTGGLCSCYVLTIAGWRRADERRRTAVMPREKGEPKDRLETGWRCRRRRNEGLAPVREDIGSKRVRPEERTLFSCSRHASVWPHPRLMSRGGTTLLRLRPLSNAAAERRRLKKARKTHRSSATKAPALRLIWVRSMTETQRTSSPVRLRDSHKSESCDFS